MITVGLSKGRAQVHPFLQHMELLLYTKLHHYPLKFSLLILEKRRTKYPGIDQIRLIDAIYVYISTQ